MYITNYIIRTFFLDKVLATLRYLTAQIHGHNGNLGDALDISMFDVNAQYRMV